MQTTISERGQVAIPAAIRKKYHLQPGMGLEWLARKEGIFIVPVSKDPIRAFRNQGKGENSALLKARSMDKKKDRRRGY